MAGFPRTANRGFAPGFAIVLLVVGFLVAAGVIQERVREQEVPGRGHELEALITARRATIEDLSGQVAELTEELGEIQSREARGASRQGRLAEELERLRGPAGIREVAGPGLVVELSDSVRVPQSRADESELRIQDSDLQLLVNELWRSGAEAVEVNGQRVVSTTAIRRGGSAVLVNFRAVSSPYRVTAIGDPERLRSGIQSSGIVDRFDVWRQVYGLGFEMRAEERVAVSGLEAFDGLRWAKPAGEGR